VGQKGSQEQQNAPQVGADRRGGWVAVLVAVLVAVKWTPGPIQSAWRARASAARATFRSSATAWSARVFGPGSGRRAPLRPSGRQGGPFGLNPPPGVITEAIE
jgi:hypothetical protein